ncbi:MAG: 5'-3' exonuclease H3TH domain-containing protein [Wenzhouxiangellaceae bacterium]
MSAPTVYLIDASVQIFRAWFSIPPDFTDPDGRPTNAVYGFSGFLCGLLEQQRPSHIALAFDESLSESFRNDIYPDYKANREPAPEELKRQFAWCRQLGTALGVPCYGHKRYEADDLIGTLASYWRMQGHPVCIITSDKDLTQLLEEGDTWWDIARRKRLDSQAVEAQFGVPPQLIADFLALTGDSIDNIPGIPGVGPKTAARLLQHFGSWNALWSGLDQVPGITMRGAASVARKLHEHREVAWLARQLTGINTEVPEVLVDPRAERGGAQGDAIEALFDQLGFGNLLRRRCLALCS